MKILDVVKQHGKIFVTTDDPGRPDFVYPADKFNSLEALEAEVQRSLDLEASREVVRDAKVQKIKDELEVKKNARA